MLGIENIKMNKTKFSCPQTVGEGGVWGSKDFITVPYDK